jgi:RHS repeat-associated protein
VLRKAEYLWDGPTVAAQWKTFADGTSEAPGEQVQEWHYDAGFTPLALVQQRGGQTQLLHVVSDLNGAPRELVSNEGELVWSGQLDTWGNLARCHVQDRDRGNMSEYSPGYRPAANDPVVDVELRFANQWADEESGLYYNLNRYYDPAIGQYASQDPLGPAGGIRTHGYVTNPTTWVDPWGLAVCPKLTAQYKAFREKGHNATEALARARAVREFADLTNSRQFRSWKTDQQGRGIPPHEIPELVHQGSLERGNNLWRNDWGKYYEEVSGTSHPGSPMHAHHLVEKAGRSAEAAQNRQILREVGLDPTLSRENLTWAPNGVVGQHGSNPQGDLLQRLTPVRGDRGEIVRVLQDEWAPIAQGR